VAFHVQVELTGVCCWKNRLPSTARDGHFRPGQALREALGPEELEAALARGAGMASYASGAPRDTTWKRQ